MEIQYSKQGLLSHSSVKQSIVGGLIPAERILVLAPHHDDEAIGCGGTILRYLNAGTQVDIIYLTDGRYGIVNEAIEIREREAKEAWKGHNVKQTFWGVEDSHLDRVDVVEKLKNHIQESKPSIIFTPWLLDQHVDHQYTSYYLKEALKQVNDEKLLICQYEVMYPLYANFIINITREFEEKMSILEKFESQVSFLDIREVARSLNEYRGRGMHFRRIKKAEAFHISNKDGYIQLINGLLKVFNEWRE